MAQQQLVCGDGAALQRPKYVGEGPARWCRRRRGARGSRSPVRSSSSSRGSAAPGRGDTPMMAIAGTDLSDRVPPRPGGRGRRQRNGLRWRFGLHRVHDDVHRRLLRNSVSWRRRRAWTARHARGSAAQLRGEKRRAGGLVNEVGGALCRGVREVSIRVETEALRHSEGRLAGMREQTWTRTSSCRDPQWIGAERACAGAQQAKKPAGSYVVCEGPVTRGGHQKRRAINRGTER
jgi:hypothetical protein